MGKAITFDTGGISIKPADKMEEMVFDKCGGMAVLGAMAGIARLKLKRNVVGIIASAENMPSATAYRPGDIVKTYDGTYVEVINTDAEGRMVLADAIAYARKDCQRARDHRSRDTDGRLRGGAGRIRRGPLEHLGDPARGAAGRVREDRRTPLAHAAL